MPDLTDFDYLIINKQLLNCWRKIARQRLIQMLSLKKFTFTPLMQSMYQFSELSRVV